MRIHGEQQKAAAQKLHAPVSGDDACVSAAVRHDKAWQPAAAGAELNRYQRRSVGKLVCGCDRAACLAQVTGERDGAAPHRAAQPRAELFFYRNSQASEAKASAPKAVICCLVAAALHGALERATASSSLIASSVAPQQSDINARGVGAFRSCYRKTTQPSPSASCRAGARYARLYGMRSRPQVT